MSDCVYCHGINSTSSQFCCQSCELLFNWFDGSKNPLTTTLNLAKWGHYQNPEIEAQFNLAEAGKNTKHFKFHLEGLQCSSCIHLLEDLPIFEPKIIKSKINFAKSVLEVEISEKMNLAELSATIESLGYSPTVFKELPDYEKAKRQEELSELKKIGVAAFVAANEMLFAVPLYAGLKAELATVFKWIAFVLFLPLLIYVASSFYKRAWSSLVTKRVSVDMMIVVALWGGFLLSTFSLVTGREDLYFDSTSSFIFLILSTRYILRFHQNKFIKKDLFVDMFKDQVYEVIKKNRSVYKVFSEVEQKDRVKLQQGQFLAFDAQLQSEKCLVDISFLNGESLPHSYYKGDVLLAGSTVLSADVEVECVQISKLTQLSKTLGQIEMLANDKIKYQTLTDIVSHRLTVVVFSVAALYFLLSYADLGYEAFKRSLALITIACPCAVAFGTPLAHHLGVRKALRNGFLIKAENVFEKISRVKKIIFDKTGTLTSSNLKMVRTFPVNLDEEIKSIILGLENNSLHPVALALKKHWNEVTPAKLDNSAEIIGRGVVGEYEGFNYELIKNYDEQNSNLIQVDFKMNGVAKAYLFFEEILRPESRAVIQDLYAKDYEVMLLSGDKRSRVLEIARKLAIRPAMAFSEKSFEDKAQFVSEQNPCIFVGDGLNDLTALKQAEVSFAVRGPFEATLQVSDIYAPQKKLSAVLEIIQLAEKVQTTVNGNLLFAVFYNATGGVLALMGFINPLVAAILMPISSLIITLHTVWRLK